MNSYSKAKRKASDSSERELDEMAQAMGNKARIHAPEIKKQILANLRKEVAAARDKAEALLHERKKA